MRNFRNKVAYALLSGIFSLGVSSELYAHENCEDCYETFYTDMESCESKYGDYTRHHWDTDEYQEAKSCGDNAVNAFHACKRSYCQSS